MNLIVRELKPYFQMLVQQPFWNIGGKMLYLDLQGNFQHLD